MAISLVAAFQRMRVLVLLFVPVVAFAQVQIDLDRPATSTMKEGLVHGWNAYASPSPSTDAIDALISQTKPGTWRFSGMDGYGYGGNIYQFVVEDYKYPARFGTSTTLVLQDIFNAKYGKPIIVGCSTGSNCFSTFDDLRKAWDATLRNFLVNTQYAQINFYDLMAEPDVSFENVSADQLYTLMKDAYQLVRQLHPDAKIVGPSLVSFKPKILLNLVLKMSQDGLHFDAISWHELGNDPDVVAGHVAAVRSAFKTYPIICDPSCPKIHINEYQGEQTTLDPGYSVGWLSALESSHVDAANRACWGGDPGSWLSYDSCWYGFEGLLTPDDTTTQPVFWVYKYYADLNGSRFASTSSIPQIAAIAGSLDGNAIGVLLGNYGTTQSNVQIQLLNFTQASAQVDVMRIPNPSDKVVAMPTPDVVSTYTAALSSSTLTVPIASFAQGDAYWITVTPEP